MGDLYALDFDGVLCDSCGETSRSGLKAARLRWPESFAFMDATLENWVLDQMHTVSFPTSETQPKCGLYLFVHAGIRILAPFQVRPVVETGYECVLLARLLSETRSPSGTRSSVSDGVTTEGILRSWPDLRRAVMDEWNVDRDSLIELFGRVRDEWMKGDIRSWIGANRFYPYVSDALRFSSSKLYIVTTKQSQFADALLRELAGIRLHPERIYGLGSGPKVEVLKKIQSAEEHRGLTFHFVEDRLATLKNVVADDELKSWKLYLAKWGYNTEEEKDEARTMPRVHLLELSDFSEKLK